MESIIDNDIKSNLINLSLKALENMYCKEKNLFHHRLLMDKGSIYKIGESLRYSLISLIGLYKAKMKSYQVY